MKYLSVYNSLTGEYEVSEIISVDNSNYHLSNGRAVSRKNFFVTLITEDQLMQSKDRNDVVLV